MIGKKAFIKLPDELKYSLYVAKIETLEGGNGYLQPTIKQGYHSNVKKVVNKYKDNLITSMSIVRTPLDSYTTLALNSVSLGQFNKVRKKNGYDNYFHLNLNIVLDNGTNLIVEKNEILNIQVGTKKTSKSEVMNITEFSSNAITLNSLLENTKKLQGSKFYVYNASSNNCQYFIRDVLLSNNIGNPVYTDFIKQNTEDIFKNSPIFRKIANSVTDLGASVKNVQDIVTVESQKINKQINKNVNKAVENVKNVFTGNGKPNFNKMKVKELKSIIKQNKKAFPQKVYVTKMKKSEMVKLLNELN